MAAEETCHPNSSCHLISNSSSPRELFDTFHIRTSASGIRRVLNYCLAILRIIQSAFVDNFTRSPKPLEEGIESRKGEVAIVTGGSRGIGAAVVKDLMRFDMHVIIACRKEGAGHTLIEEIRKEGIQTGSAEVLVLDLCSLDSVRRFAQVLKERNTAISILINNAGIMFHPFELTQDGLESQFQTNYLGHFLLTELLLPLLVLGGSLGKCSRIVNVSSIAADLGTFSLSHFRKTHYNRFMVYFGSKLMQIAATKHLNARLESQGDFVRAYSLHPGTVASELYMHLWYIRIFDCIVKTFFKSTSQAAHGIVYVALSPKVEDDGGHYFMHSTKYQPNPLASNAETQEQLVHFSKKLVGLKSDRHDENNGCQ